MTHQEVGEWAKRIGLDSSPIVGHWDCRVGSAGVITLKTVPVAWDQSPFVAYQLAAAGKVNGRPWAIELRMITEFDPVEVLDDAYRRLLAAWTALETA